jgi:hypothetical protein
MAVFVTNIKRLRLVYKPTSDHIIDGRLMVKQGKTLEFGNEGRYEADDKSEIKWLREHESNGNNPKHTNVLFFELDFKEEDYLPAASKVKGAAKSTS